MPSHNGRCSRQRKVVTWFLQVNVIEFVTTGRDDLPARLLKRYTMNSTAHRLSTLRPEMVTFSSFSPLTFLTMLGFFISPKLEFLMATS